MDFNRAGCALVEIVFMPDIRSANDAASVLSTLRDTMRYIGTCDGRMEEGSLRCDLNISIAPIDYDKNDENDHDSDNPFQDSLTTWNRTSCRSQEFEFHQARYVVRVLMMSTFATYSV